MILADTLAETFRNSEGIAPAAKDLRVMLDGSPKYVFEPQTARLAAQAIAAPADLADQIPIPDQIAWLEFHLDGKRLGFFLYGSDDDLRTARCLIVEHLAGAPDLTVTTEMLDMEYGGLQAQTNYNPLLLGALTLLATPALIERREVRQDRINRARLRRNRSRLYDHSDLRLVDLDLARPQGSGIDSKVNSGRRAHRREHFCRAHLRFKRGRFEYVRPHWRGDPKLGHVRPAYRVKL